MLCVVCKKPAPKKRRTCSKECLIARQNEIKNRWSSLPSDYKQVKYVENLDQKMEDKVLHSILEQ